MTGRYWLETLGCPKNQVDSDKLEGTLLAGGYVPAADPAAADLVVVNTCAFVEAAREESVEVILDMAARRQAGSRVVVTGCLAERYGEELRSALPEVDLVAGFGMPLIPPVDSAGSLGNGTAQSIGRAPAVPTPVELRRPPAFDLLNMPRPRPAAPWAYLKVAEGCDRHCGFCAIPSFRGLQRSRSKDAIMEEVDALGEQVREIVLVAQDLASWGLDRSEPDPDRPRGRLATAGGPSQPGGVSRGVLGGVLGGVPNGVPNGVPGGVPEAVHLASLARRSSGRERPLVGLLRTLCERIERVRLLYLYPSSLDDDLIDAIIASGVPYFDLSLQHVSRPLLARMRRFGEGRLFLDRIARIRDAEPEATFRSSFILGYPGETEEDHDLLLDFIEKAELDWAGFFPFSEEPGTYAAELGEKVHADVAMERLRECAELQDAITARKRDALVGQTIRVLVDAPGVARSHREAPEIDGVVSIPPEIAAGEMIDVVVTGAMGPDLEAQPAGSGRAYGQ